MPERDVIRGQVRRRARPSAQKRKRLSIFQQIPQTGPAAQGKDDNNSDENVIDWEILYYIMCRFKIDRTVYKSNSS